MDAARAKPKTINLPVQPSLALPLIGRSSRAVRSFTKPTNACRGRGADPDPRRAGRRQDAAAERVHRPAGGTSVRFWPAAVTLGNEGLPYHPLLHARRDSFERLCAVAGCADTLAEPVAAAAA